MGVRSSAKLVPDTKSVSFGSSTVSSPPAAALGLVLGAGLQLSLGFLTAGVRTLGRNSSLQSRRLNAL